GAEAEDDQVGVQGPLGGPDGPDPVAALDRLHLLLQVQLDPDVPDGLGDELAHVGVEPAHDLGGGLDQGGADAPGDQGFGRLQADVTAADDHRPLRAGVDRPAELDAVLEHGQAVHPGRVDAGDGRSQRLGPGGHHQHVPCLLDHAAAVEVADPDPPGLKVDGVDLVAGADLDVLFGELLGGAGDQVAPVLDHVGGVVGEPAGRVG